MRTAGARTLDAEQGRCGVTGYSAYRNPPWQPEPPSSSDRAGHSQEGHQPAAMKQLVASRVVDIPSDVTFEVKARTVRVKGPRGEMLQQFDGQTVAPVFRWGYTDGLVIKECDGCQLSGHMP